MNADHLYSQADGHPIHLVDIHQSYLIYFQLFNMLKVKHNKNRLKFCIFHFIMLHLVFPHSNQRLFF